jgi:hypothetical protein
VYKIKDNLKSESETKDKKYWTRIKADFVMKRLDYVVDLSALVMACYRILSACASAYECVREAGCVKDLFFGCC